MDPNLDIDKFSVGVWTETASWCAAGLQMQEAEAESTLKIRTIYLVSHINFSKTYFEVTRRKNIHAYPQLGSSLEIVWDCCIV